MTRVTGQPPPPEPAEAEKTQRETNTPTTSGHAHGARTPRATPPTINQLINSIDSSISGGGRESALTRSVSAVSRRLASVRSSVLRASRSSGGCVDAGLLELEMGCVPAVLGMEACGLRVDVRGLRRWAVRLRREVQRCESDFRQVCWSEGVAFFNVRSNSACLRAVRTLGYPVSSADARELELLGDPLVHAMVGLRRLLYAQRSAAAMLRAQRRGVLRGRFDQLGSVTGRIQTRTYNLMGIPGELRDCVCAPPGRVFLLADYRAMDFTVLAGLSGDPLLRQLVANDGDFYEGIGRKVYGLCEIDPEVRAMIKLVSLAITYGKTAYRLSKELDCSLAEAEGALQAMKAAFPVAEAFLEDKARIALETRELFTRIGRRRGWEQHERKDVVRRQARNYAIQAHAADLFKDRLAALHEHLVNSAIGRVALTVHDAFLLELKESIAVGAIPEISEILSHSPALEIPLKLHVGIGRTWGAAEGDATSR